MIILITLKLMKNSSYAHIIKTNYYCFITTNFDGVPYRHAENLINNIIVSVYPDNLLQINRKSINYLHGAGFEIIENYKPQVILAEKEYDIAYNKRMFISRFFIHDIRI